MVSEYRWSQGQVSLHLHPIFLHAGQLFYVVCGSEYDHYLEAHSANKMNILTGVSDKKEACVFYVVETKGPYKYKLLMHHDEWDRLYIARNEKRSTGRGSVQVGAGYAIKFSLDAGGASDLTISDWETMPCRINIAPQSEKKGNAGFLGYREQLHKCKFVADDSAEAEGEMWLHFKLERVEVRSSKEGVFRAPNEVRVRHRIINNPCLDDPEEEDSEEDDSD